MELKYDQCYKKMQYKVPGDLIICEILNQFYFQLKCHDFTKDQQCLLINNFLEDCTRLVLGKWTFGRSTYVLTSCYTFA